jgi:hypothetical protein
MYFKNIHFNNKTKKPTKKKKTKKKNKQTKKKVTALNLAGGIDAMSFASQI